ncbi:MAG TPA: DNA gyrase C-terminal beta-propeller domain-containing protein, partial [Flavipsychrobacter sp.]|nr:DNA gyrase C-terminal beta-propeller domain-containing protein [Flavipsychrobacter sp.]
VMMAVKSGRAICFEESKVRETGRGAIGVFGIELDENNDEVIGMVCVAKKDMRQKQILVVSEKGLGKRTPFIEEIADGENTEDMSNLIELTDENGNTKKYQLAYRITNRGGKGVRTINITDKTGALVGLLSVEEKEDLIITCKSGITIRMNVASIREAGRATQGVRLINLDGGDSIAAIARIEEQEQEENGENVDTSTEASGEVGENAPE